MSRPTVCSTSKSDKPTRRNDDAQKQKMRTPFANNLPVPESRLIGYYSVDHDRKLLLNASKLMYYNPPAMMKVSADQIRNVRIDLNEGIDAAVRRDIFFLDKNIDILLQWIKLNRNKIESLKGKFVCTRGTLDVLLRSITEPQDSWIIYAARWKGTIYLRTDKSLKMAELSSDHYMKIGSWAHKFEQCVLSKSPNELPDTTKPVIETERFSCVYQRNIGSHSVMFCSIMKGLISNKSLQEPLPLNDLKFIEIGTHRNFKSGYHKAKFNKFKTLKWWTQCYLTNTKHVLCGFRNSDGIVHKLAIYNLETIIKMGKTHWHPRCCVNFCDSMLTKIQETVVRDCVENIYKFEKSPDGKIVSSELPASSEHAFLPSSFLEASG